MFTHLEIETQGSCNRGCDTCLRQSYVSKDNPTHKGRFPISAKIGEGTKMPTETYKSVVDQARDLGFSGTMCMQHYNEPLLDERLVDLARYAKENLNLVQLGICSNMDLITEKTAAALDGILDKIDVALYMPEEKQKKREEYLLTLFKKTRLYFTKGVHIITHYSPFANTEARVEVQKTKPCTYYNNQLIIAYDGTILHCCDDYVGHFGLGNVKDMTLKEIWESKVHKELVKTLSQPNGRLKYSYCSICPR
jgi:radical SAM protein with 4Fe4S-binding SPASM domain